ncbi:response regulator [Dyadobacter fanqingshengii]|uniref:Response regulator n=1 Tax=Dyadobacter fanqingshengii TaxID=2906443 RepID=A0A9X1T9M2_9BACT|nr:response regulator [Dyadobacter fanqingshengii]MCF0040144.1 response regulator [Dyadobacter fanqingshengii]MCF2502367.1 response regulator [Dyadobacter fanqingshengii]USJ38104.1 response regulator [Dyadobacter fanqingshengii]
MKEPKTIYLADDDQDDRFFLRQAIKAANAFTEIIEVENGLELITVMKKQPSLRASLILMDMNMPKMNGLETITAIRADATLSTVPVVMISTSSNSSLIEMAYEAGADSFITKPSTFEEFNRLGVQLTEKFLS